MGGSPIPTPKKLDLIQSSLRDDLHPPRIPTPKKLDLIQSIGDADRIADKIPTPKKLDLIQSRYPARSEGR